MFALLSEQIGSRPMPIKKVSVFVNGSTQKSFVMQFKHELQFQELAKALEAKWGARFGKNVRLFNSEGVQYDHHDLAAVRDNDNLYVSRGEQFDPNSGLCEYEILKEIGEGGFGRVMLATHKTTNQHVAIKLMKADKITSAASIDQIFREAESLKGLQHPNIVRIYNCYALREMQVVMIMEYLEGGELLEYLQARGHLPLQQALVFFKQIVAAMHYCHGKNIVHRDLKLENVLLKKKGCTDIKVADFGIAGIADRTNPNIDCGTLKYMAPEVLSGAERQNSPAADVWALGCIFFYLLFGRPPFCGKTGIQTKQLILDGTYRFDPKIPIGRPAQKLIAKMLQKSAKMRIKTQAIVFQLHKIEDKVNFFSSGSESDLSQTEVSKTFPVKCSNPQSDMVSVAKLRKDLRYRHLRPLNMMQPQSQQQSRKVSLDMSVLDQPKNFLIRKPQQRKRPSAITNIERRGSIDRHSFSFRDKVTSLGTPCTPCTPCTPGRMRSRQSIFDIKKR